MMKNKIELFMNKYNLYEKEIKQIEKWCELKLGEVLFDSDIDDWSTNKSTFPNKILNKSKIVFVIEDINKNKFGCYLNTNTGNICDKWVMTDKKTFLFSLQSNGRIKEGMMKFEIRNTIFGIYIYSSSSIDWLFGIGSGCSIEVFKKHKKFSSYCIQNLSFDFHGYDYALCGSKNFSPTRFVVIQMK